MWVMLSPEEERGMKSTTSIYGMGSKLLKQLTSPERVFTPG